MSPRIFHFDVAEEQQFRGCHRTSPGNHFNFDNTVPHLCERAMTNVENVSRSGASQQST